MVDKTKCPHGAVRWIQDQEGDWHQSIAYEVHDTLCTSPRRFGGGSETIPRRRISRGKVGMASLFTHTMTKNADEGLRKRNKWTRTPLKTMSTVAE